MATAGTNTNAICLKGFQNDYNSLADGVLSNFLHSPGVAFNALSISVGFWSEIALADA